MRFVIPVIILLVNLVIAATELFSPQHYPYNHILLIFNSICTVFVFLVFIAGKFKQHHPPIPIQTDDNAFFTNEWIINNIPNIFCIKDAKGRWLQASPVYLELLGLEKAKYQGKTNNQLVALTRHRGNAKHLDGAGDEQVWKKGRAITVFEKFTNPDLNVQSVELCKTPIYDHNEKPFKLIIIGSNLTPDKRKLNNLKLISTVFNHNAESILILDPEFNIIRANQSFTKLSGYSERNITGWHLSILNEQQHNEVMFETIRTYIENNQQWEGELSCRRKDGSTFPAKLSLSPVINHTVNKLTHYIGTLTDITAQKAAKDHILRLAHFDDLTELPNRIMFIRRLKQILSRAKRHKLSSTLLFLDLDHFKTINDTIGHHGGDELLRQAAKRLIDAIREEDTVARLSGDEFAILLEDYKSYEQASYAATLIANKVISALSEPFYIQKRKLFIGASIGIAIYPDDALNAQDLLKFADIAMYKAKNHGRNNYHFFKKEYINALNDRQQLEIDMRKALERREFRLFYQPQYAADSKKLIGAEVLVRWFKSEKKIVPPYQFIPLAEETGLIVPLGQWILETACQRQKDWLDAGYGLAKISVNISARQFLEANFLQMVENALKNSALDPRYLELEITESMLMGDIKKVILQLQRLHNMGISLAIDDFGTGYSSLSYLKEFPIDILKIDQSFVRDIPDSQKDTKIVCAIIEMGHSLGLKIVAEGVETAAHLDFLKLYECDIIQGYFFNPPLPENEMTELVKKLPGRSGLSHV